jgi:prepilin-type N-terminal cleavage/methylation domain-containing protein
VPGQSFRRCIGADSRDPGFGQIYSGFTLVEIMIVVAIVAIVFAVGAPSFVKVIQKGPMRQAVSDVMEALGHARAQAILRGVPAVFFLNGEGEIRVLPNGNGETESSLPAGEAGTRPPRSAFSAWLDRDIAVTLLEVNFRNQMDAEETRVRFYPNGTCDDFTIVLEGGGQIRKIWLDPITALADLETLR